MAKKYYLENKRKKPSSLKNEKMVKNGEGGPPMDTNERVTRLEASFEHMKKDLSDLKIMVVGGVFTILFGVAGVVYWQGTWFQHSLDQSREELKTTLAVQKAEQDRKDAEWKAAQDKRDAEWNARMDKNEARWDRMLNELHSQDKRISKIESK